MNLPSGDDVVKIWDKYGTPQHIRAHMRQVNRVAVYLATELQAVGESVSIELVDRASILHDTLRVTEWEQLSFEYFPTAPRQEEIRLWEEQRLQYPSHIHHSEVNRMIFQEQYPEMASVISLHSIMDAPDVRSWEEKIVNYADRRVAHDTIVTVAERLEEAYQRYAPTGRKPLERDPAVRKAITSIEEEIFTRIGGDPDHLPL